MTTATSMSSNSQNTITDELRQDFRALYIKTLRDMENDHKQELAFFYFGKPETCNLLRIEEAGMISWTKVRSLKKVLRAVGREDLGEAWGEYEIRRNLALLLDASARIRKGIARKNRFEHIETISKPYLANLPDNALDKNTVRSLRRSKRSVEEVMISLKEQMETRFSEPWSKRLTLITATAGVLLSETKNEESASPLPEDVMRCSDEICSTMKSLGEWVRPINHWSKLKVILISVVTFRNSPHIIHCNAFEEGSAQQQMKRAKTYPVITCLHYEGSNN